jgi:hypothetical protein
VRDLLVLHADGGDAGGVSGAAAGAGRGRRVAAVGGPVAGGPGRALWAVDAARRGRGGPVMLEALVVGAVVWACSGSPGGPCSCGLGDCR